MNYQKFLKTAGLFLLLAPMVELCNAQNGSWQPLWLSTTNVFKGIEGFYQLSNCNGSDVVFIKLINHNGFKVKAGWKNVAMDNSGQQKQSASVQDSVTIAPNAQVEGSCTGAAKLQVKLSDFGITGATFKAFMCSGFDYKIYQ